MTQNRRSFDIPRPELTPRQAELVARIEAGPRGRVPINLRAWMHNPDFVEVVEPFGLYVSSEAPITARQKEIAVLVGARFWKARFEWAMHEKHARKAGLTEAQIASLREGKDPGFEDPVESLTYRLAAALHSDERRIDQALYDEALARFGHKGVSDLIGLIGLYTMIAMTLNFYDVPPPEG